VEGQEEIPKSWFSSSLKKGDTATPVALDFQPEAKLKQL
jgi:hypothetical protein